MRFIIDAHLPKSVAKAFSDFGCEVIHTRDLPKGNATSDKDIILLAGDDGIIISKDEDFYHSFLIQGKPPQLVLVKVGNMKLKDITNLFVKTAPKIIDLLRQHDLLELHKDKIIVIA